MRIEKSTMIPARKYIQLVLPAPQLGLVCAVLKSHIRRHAMDAGTGAALDALPDKSGRLLDLMLHSLLLDRTRTRLIVTDSQFTTLCHAIGKARERIQARLHPGQAQDGKRALLLDQLSKVEACLANARHDPTRFDVPGADAYQVTVLGTARGVLTRD